MAILDLLKQGVPPVRSGSMSPLTTSSNVAASAGVSSGGGSKSQYNPLEPLAGLYSPKSSQLNIPSGSLQLLPGRQAHSGQNARLNSQPSSGQNAIYGERLVLQSCRSKNHTHLCWRLVQIKTVACAILKSFYGCLGGKLRKKLRFEKP